MKSTSNVLIVDDSPSLAQSLCKILAMHEIKADAVFNAQDALHKIRRNRYELMLCDIEMPGFPVWNCWNASARMKNTTWT